jgi:predicted nucleic acid-binding protein
MRAVSNTSPISNLAIIGRLDFLQRRYQRVHIPEEVREELTALSHQAARQAIEDALVQRWLVVEKLTENFPQPSGIMLDRGETAAILLARQMNAEVLLMDERQGREAARRLGLEVGGVLGELIYAKNAKWIPSIRDEIARLRQDARFFVDSEIERFILAQVGE